MENLKITGIQQIMDIHGAVTGSWQVKGRNKFSLVIYILEQEDRMNDQQKRNHTASLRYINSLNAEMHSTGENHCENWLTDCRWYALIKLPPPV